MPSPSGAIAPGGTPNRRDSPPTCVWPAHSHLVIGEINLPRAGFRAVMVAVSND